MTDFVTLVKISEPDFQISYQSKLFFMGSCFADYMGKKMKELRFPVCHNPFGVLYNPMSIAGNLELIINKKQFTGDDISFYNELWFSYAHYTLFSHPDKKTCLANINSSFAEARKYVTQAKFFFITLGTSWVYRLKETGKVVANCHKQPASFFERSFLSTEQSYEALRQCIERIQEVNSDAKFIFTVSPIRHWKDGAVGNQRSKAALILTIKMLQELNSNIYYFPAYEIFMDELRDYRFYASDMLHPSDFAQLYTWNRFSEYFILAKDMEIMRDVERILISVKHKPLFPNTKAYVNFRQSIIDKIKTLSDTYTFLDLKGLLQYFENNV